MSRAAGWAWIVSVGSVVLGSVRAGEEPSDHWAFRPVVAPQPPEVRGTAWVRNPIDRFVLARLEARGWAPAPPADPERLLRRLCFSLTGLPPTLEQRAEFLADPSPEGIDRLVDRLLASPRYGERWGRHWLDLARYAETNGYERDATKPEVWRYRDYVIRAFNEDRPYDRFILEQLAGDELDDATPETRIATTFLRLGPWDDEPADPALDRYDQLDDIVSTAAQVFLGLTMGCARCHDHKFEPLTQRDYYSMVAVFAPLERPQNGRTDLAAPLGTASERAALAERDRRIADLAGIAESCSGRKFAPTEGSHGFAFVAENRAARAWCLETIANARRAVPDLPQGYVFREAASPARTHVLRRGSPSALGDPVEPAVPEVLPARGWESFTASAANGTSRRRLALARWIAHRDNPLTARVMVNRVWQHHFGTGLVGSPSDFGTNGDPPTHQELLDWLAEWFVRHDGSVKSLQRLILTSNAARMSSRFDAEKQVEDPENTELWHVPPRRLEFEAIRDGMLQASGRLDLRMGGPGFFEPVPKSVLENHSDPDKVWVASSEADASRRSVYGFVKRSLVVPMFEVLDFCDTARTAPRRAITHVPTQALTLLNGDFVNRQARHFAARLARETDGSPEAVIGRAFVLALSREVTESERRVLMKFLNAEGTAIRAESPGLSPDAIRTQARERLCRAVFNLNEFVFVD